MPLVIFLVFVLFNVGFFEAGASVPVGPVGLSNMRFNMPKGGNFAKRKEGPMTAAQQFGYGPEDFVQAKNRLEDCPDVKIHEIRLNGAKALSDAEKEALVADYVGKKLSIEDLRRLKSEIYKYYLAKGYLFCRVFLPTQRVTDGDVDFYIRESNISRIALLGEENVRKSPRVLGWVKRLRSCKTDRQYMRILKLMQKAQGFKVIAAVIPLKGDPTQLELRLQVREKRFSGNVGVSNSLLKKEVGPIVGNAGVDFKNLCGLNEKLELDVQSALNPREMLSFSTALALPLGLDGFGLLGGVNLSKSEPSVVPEDGPSYRSGQVSRRCRLKAAATYPFLLRSNFELTGEFGVYKYGTNTKIYAPGSDPADRTDPTVEKKSNYGWGRAKLRLKGSTGPLRHVLLLSGTYQPSFKEGDQMKIAGDDDWNDAEITKARAFYGMYNMFAKLPKQFSFALTLCSQLSADKRQPLDKFRPVG